MSMIDIVIVNWNSGLFLHQCINSIIQCNSPFLNKVVVVDNGSTDDSIDNVVDFPSVVIIRIGQNIGFASACNIGARICNSPYLLFLNPDTRVESNSFSVPLFFMEKAENSNVGICGIQLVDESGNISRTCSRYPTLSRFISSVLGLNKLPRFGGSGMSMREWDHRESRYVDQVIGAFFFCRRNLFNVLGGFDEQFFVYYEEVDFSLRSTLCGWSTYYLSNSQAFHAGGGTSQQVKAHRLFYSLRSRLLFAFKHFPRWQFFLLLLLTCVLEPISRTAWCLMRGDVLGVKHTWSAYGMLFVNMKFILRGEGRRN